MLPRPSLIVRCLASAALATAMLLPTQALSGMNDRDFFEKISGQWKGPGEIVAGKYKGTKFTCDLTGEPANGKDAGITLQGFCRVGVFKQPMSATILQNGKSYAGKFLDGAAGKGLDIISGTVVKDKAVVGITRKKLNGAMVARLADNETMNITISVKVEETMVPVIGVSLNRQVDDIAVGSIK